LRELNDLEEEYRAFGLPVFLSMANSDHNFVVNRGEKFEKIRSVLEKFQESAEKIEYTAEDRDRR
jgi:hypothetical protein